MKKILMLTIPMLIIAIYAYITYGNIIEKSINKEPSDLPISPASVAVDVSDEPEYTHDTFGYTIHIPDEMEVDEVTPYSIQINNTQKELGIGPVNFVYISVITPEQYENDGEIYNYRPSSYKKLMAAEEIGNTIDLSDGEMTEWFTYTYVEDREIDGITAKLFENTKPWEFPAGTTETRFIFENDGTRYVVGYYTGGDSIGNSELDPRTASSIVQSIDLN